LIESWSAPGPYIPTALLPCNGSCEKSHRRAYCQGPICKMQRTSKSTDGLKVFSPVDGDLSLLTRFGDDPSNALGLLSYTLSPTSMYSHDDPDVTHKTTNFSYPRPSQHQRRNPFSSQNPYRSQNRYQSPTSPSSMMSIPRKPVAGNYAKLPVPQHQESFDTIQTKPRFGTIDTIDTIDSYESLPEQRPHGIAQTINRSKSYLEGYYAGLAESRRLNGYNTEDANPVESKHQQQQTYSVEPRQRNDSCDDSIDMKKEEFAPKAKRGWRFYGTFACLALVTLVCAIDAVSRNPPPCPNLS
jgi:hypothetical protein